MGLRLAATTALLAMTTTYLSRSGAQAASFEVTNLNDAGSGSLRDAIAAANGTAGPDVITFATGVTGTILLSSGQLTISDSLQIVGPGRGALAVDGGGTGRVFDIPLSPGDVDVSMSGLTISNGHAQDGGGIRLQDERLTLDDVALVDNTAVEEGGGLYADGFAMTLTVRNSTISGNAASGGGGVYVEDTQGVTTFDGVVVDGNTATAKGGGIFLYDPDADVVIDNSTITDNTAAKGGGIYLYSQDGGSVTISNSTISGNAATTGGGVYLYDIDHPLSITHSTISGNTATNGAGINIDRISAPATITNSTISGNTATGAGGGVRLARGGGLTIAHSTITENSAADAGGARFPGPVTLSHVIVAGNTAGTTADLHAAGGATTDFSIIGAMIGAVTDGGGNQLGVTDPLLAPLAANGGPTLTHLPLDISPAIDTGNPATSASGTDQRGMPRVAGIIDIGAVETQGSTIQFDDASVTVAENAGTLTVTVTRTGTGDLPATVEIATADDTAIAPGDYGTLSTQLSWAARETGSKTVDIPVTLDAAHEIDETFTVTLTSPTGATLGTRTSLAVTIQDWNTAPTTAPPTTAPPTTAAPTTAAPTTAAPTTAPPTTAPPTTAPPTTAPPTTTPPTTAPPTTAPPTTAPPTTTPPTTTATTTTTTEPPTTSAPPTTTPPTTPPSPPTTTTTTTPVAPPAGPPECSGVTLATQKILGGGQTIPVPVSLPDGVYSITLISYDPTHAAGVQVEQTAEQWVLEAFAGEQLVYTSPPITDLAEAALSLIEDVDHDVALSGVTSLRARHVGGGLNSIMPVCASFERTGDLSSPGTTGLDAPSTPSDQSITCPEGTKPEADADDQQQQQDPDDLP